MKDKIGRFIKRKIEPLQWWWTTHIRALDYFICNQKKYTYNASRYNFSYANERSVEIPMFEKILASQKVGARVLEIGNVLSHYAPRNHDILDKYEKSRGVINQDIVDFKTSKKYDLILSISTLEHVGWDEVKKDPTKIPKSLKNIQSLLSKHGQFWFSVPLGYNRFLDELIEKKTLPLQEYYLLKRVTGFTNRWQQVDESQVRDAGYGTPYPHANVVMIARA